jgi:pyrimidine-nucleoside phosphorylase
MFTDSEGYEYNPMRAVDVIRKKRDGEELAPDEIDSFVRGATGGWAQYQLSALLMAICIRGMSAAETAQLTRSMASSGKILNLSDIPGPKVDKHSTGGVGDKTSLITGPLAAACGVIVPMMSGRGLGHSGGTLDKLESIPGFRVGLSETEFRTALWNVGLGMIGQTVDIAPADKALYSLRDVTGTVESIPLITASILSKKLAEGISGLVMDVKCGNGAFMKNRADAKALADSLVNVGAANGLKVSAFITAMDTPLGRYVGNALEVIEAIETLKGRGPSDLTNLSVLLAARMVLLAGLAATEQEAQQKVRAALVAGAGLEMFRRCIEEQGGDPHALDDYYRLPTAPRSMDVVAPRSGFVTEMVAGAVGIASMVLGGGRERAEDSIDHSVGIICRAKPGEQVRAGEAVYEVRYRSSSKLFAALPVLEESFTIGDAPPADQPLVMEDSV